MREFQNVIERPTVFASLNEAPGSISPLEKDGIEADCVRGKFVQRKILRGDDLKRIERESIVVALEHVHC